MSNKYLPNRVTSKKVLICLLVGFILFIMCLGLTWGYFDLDENERPSFINFAKNLANALNGDSSLWDWFTDDIDRLGQYLADNVPWWPILMVVVAFIGFCYSIFQILKAAVKAAGKDMAPFNWEFKSDILSKLSIGNLVAPWVNKLQSNAPKKDKLDVKESVASALKDAKGVVGNKYLFLIDKYAPNDHFAKFWDTTAKQFEQKGIKTDRYYYHGDPRLCFSDALDEGATLAELAELHPDSILVIIGDGNILLDVKSPQLNSWTNIFNKWEVRFVLSPKNFFEWDKREQLYKGLFHMFPAKLSSIQYLFNQPNSEGEIEYDIRNHVDEHIIDYQLDPLDHLNIHAYFTKPTIDWISACALYPSLHFDLSLEIGKKIFAEYNLTVSEENKVEFSPEIILSVFELPWFRSGTIPEASRADQGKQMLEKSAKTGQAIRLFLATLLPEHRPPEESYPGYKNGEFERINQWYITDPERTKEEKKEIKDGLNWIYFLGFVPDRILSITDGVHNRISRHFPEKPRKFIFNQGYSGLGLTQHFKNILYSICAGVALLCFYLLIIWLSRPMDEGICMPVSQTLHGSADNPVTIFLKGTPTKPVSAYLLGQSPGATNFEVSGSDVAISSAGNVHTSLSGYRNQSISLNKNDTLKLFIRDSIAITARAVFDISLIACLDDSVGFTIDCPENRAQSSSTSYSVKPNDPVKVSRPYFGFPLLDFILNKFNYGGKSYLFAGTTPSSIDGQLSRTDCPGTRFMFLLKEPDPNIIYVDTLLGRDGIFGWDTTIESETTTRLIPVSYRDTLLYIFDRVDTSRIVIIEDIPNESSCDSIVYDTVKIRIPITEPPGDNPCDSIPCDSIPVPKMSISGNITHCKTDEATLVSVDELPEVLISNGLETLTVPLTVGGSNSYRFYYEGLESTPVYLTYNLPQNSQFQFHENSSNVLSRTIKDKSSVLKDLMVVDPTTLSQATIKLTGDIVILCDLGGNAMQSTIGELASGLRITHEEKAHTVTVKQQKGYFCQDLNVTDFCESKLVIQYERFQIDSTLYLRDFKWIRQANGEALVDFGTVFFKASDVSCT